jgi:hypothetical protein
MWRKSGTHIVNTPIALIDFGGFQLQKNKKSTKFVISNNKL